MSEPLSKHSALVAEFEAIEDGEAFVAKINEVAPLWPELRGPVADIGARKFEDWHGIVEAWDRAAARSKGLAEQKVIEPAPEEPKPLRRRFTGDAKPAEPELNPALAELLGLKAKPEPIDEEPETEFVEEPEPEPPFEFHPSDFAGAGEAEPVTIEERAKLISELADLHKSDPYKYALRKGEVAKRLAVNQATVERMVKQERDRRPKDDDEEQSQATRLMAIGFGIDFRLWHSPDGVGFASVRVGDHWENYRIKSTAFEQRLRTKYGEENRVKVGAAWVPQVPGTAALRDALASLESYAKCQGKEFTPAVRVGGKDGVIYLDLGRPEWNAVEITASGCRVVKQAEVAFIRTGTMLPLPVPKVGGNVRKLAGLLNVRPGEFVLAAGWLLQALNPEGPYPLINPHGEAEAGKSTFSRYLLRTVDPNSAGLRKAKKVDDLMVAAKNNWTVGFDNFSWMPAEWADALCMLATGIAIGGRKLYTDDEEHSFVVERPVLFNGIPPDLAERGDLASRTIRLEIPPLANRRTEADLEREFVAVWPEVLGALLDGVVAALANATSVDVTEIGAEPARLMDFEKWAEAGCRGMGFAEWEFVEAYAANRAGSMAAAAEGHPVARAVMALLKASPKGFRGQMSKLLEKLELYKGNVSWRDKWPRDAIRLGSELRRVRKPLAAVGITVLTGVDRRADGGSQKDVVVEWAEVA